MLQLTRRQAGAIAGASILLPRFAKAAEINWKFTSSQAASHPSTIRYIEASVGRATWQTDYSDYRVVSGVKMPFKWTLLWQSGKNEVELDKIQANVAIPGSPFAKP